MIRDRLTPGAERMARQRVLSPFIVEAKEGRLDSVVDVVASLTPGELMQRGKWVQRLPEVTAFRFRTRVLDRFNQVLTILPRDGVFDLAEDRNVERIFPDEFQYALQFPEVPSEGVFELRDTVFTTTFYTKEIMGAHHANEVGYDGRGTHVTVVDTGGAHHHEQTTRAVFETVQEGQRADSNQHGQWCLSCIGGKRRLNQRMSRRVGKDVWCEGMSPECGLLGVKALGYVIGTGLTSQILDGMHLGLERGTDIISMSLGGELTVEEPEDSSYHKPLKILAEEGILPIVAAGNSGPESGTIGSPGGLPYAISVGAFNPMTGEIADFSSRGPTPWGSIQPDFIAPGVRIMSGAKGQMDYAGVGMKDNYSEISGTSMACPAVSGIISLMRDAMADRLGRVLTFDDIITIGEEFGDTPKNNDSGWGLLDWSKFEAYVSTEFGVTL